jgi:hypothetical protein
MGISNLHTLYEVTHDTTQIPQITSMAMSPENQVAAEAMSGEVFPRFAVLLSQSPVTSFDTSSIAIALATCGLTGSDIAALAARLAFYAQKYAQGAMRASGSNHRKMTINEGIVIPTRLAVPHQSNATLTYQVAITYDGSNNPIVLSESVALPAAATVHVLHTIGQMTVAGNVFTQLSNFSIDFGSTIKTDGSDSDIWPTHASIETIAPRIQLQGSEVKWWIDSGGIPLLGAAAAHADTICYLRKRSATGFVADGTAEHIKFTAKGLVHHTNLFGASAGASAESAIEIVTEYDGTNYPLTIDTASAIT